MELRTKNSRKSEVRNLIPTNWFNSCIDSLFADMTLTLHKSQAHHSGFMQGWACNSLMSAIFPAEVGCETGKRIVLPLVFLRNNNKATNLQRFISSYGRKRFAACDRW